MINKLIRNISKDFIDQVIKVFPYFFVFYLISFIISFFSPTFRLFFYWKAFHIAIFTMITIIIIDKKNELKNIIVHTNIINYSFWNNFISFFKLGYKFYIKFLIIILITIYCIFIGMPLIELSILSIGLISVFLLKDSRILAGITIALLLYCLVLVIYNKDVLAETYSSYAYYLLIIIAITHIMSGIKSNKNKSQTIQKISINSKHQYKRFNIKIRSVE